MLKLSSFCCLVAAFPTNNAFVAHQSLAKAVMPTTTTLFVSQPLPPVDESTPGFGRPLDENTKKFNENFVIMIKKIVFDTFFAEQTVERSFARFWALEEIARMPYFSYLFALHFYETLGWWRRSDYLKIHFAETWNEQHHLLIMEELGGDKNWADRFLAQHMALGYFALALMFYMFNPTYAYNFNQAVEEEAFETYSRFLENNEEYLKKQPAPEVAKKYYLGEDSYMFTAISKDARPNVRPKMKTLYDCFSAIRDDEGEHAKTMIAMQEECL